MSVYVVDASVAAKWFLNEDLSDRAQMVLQGGYSLHAPDFLLLEMDSIFLKRVRRGDISSTDGEDARRILRQLPIERHAFTAFLDRAYEVAGLTGRSVYGSLYVALALLLDTRVITADRRLYEGAKRRAAKEARGVGGGCEVEGSYC